MTTTPINSTTSPMSRINGTEAGENCRSSRVAGKRCFSETAGCPIEITKILSTPPTVPNFWPKTAQFTMVEKLTTMVEQGEEVALSQQETQAAPTGG